MTSRARTARRSSSRGELRRVVAALAVVGLAWLPAACSKESGNGSSSPLEATPVTTVPGPYTFDYTIPVGTASKIAVGIDPRIMPSEITARVGDTIRITNDDTSSHTVGTFYVLAGTTLTYRFSTAGVFEGVCSTTPSDTFILTVLEN